MIEYPKIETLYNRDEKTFQVLTDKFRIAEFGNIRRWHITEKVDGTNVRVCLSSDGNVSFYGRTDNADMHITLKEYLQQTFPAEKLLAAFDNVKDTEIILFGEGYGAKIQKGGGSYRKGVSFRLFDVLVGQWWLEPAAIADIAAKLNILTVPYLGEIETLPQSVDDLKALIGNDGKSMAAIQDGGVGARAEGIVARTTPLLFTRRGNRLMWKLKFRDFA